MHSPHQSGPRNCLREASEAVITLSQAPRHPQPPPPPKRERSVDPRSPILTPFSSSQPNGGSSWDETHNVQSPQAVRLVAVPSALRAWPSESQGGTTLTSASAVRDRSRSPIERQRYVEHGRRRRSPQRALSPDWTRDASESSEASIWSKKGHGDEKGPRYGVVYWSVDKGGRGWDLGASQWGPSNFPRMCKYCDSLVDSWKGRSENAQVTLRMCALEGPGFKRYMKHFLMVTPQACVEFELRKYHRFNKNTKRGVLSERQVLGGLLSSYHNNDRSWDTGMSIRNTLNCYKELIKKRAKRYRRQAHKLGGQFIAILLDQDGYDLDPYQMTKYVTINSQGATDAAYRDIKRVLIILGGPHGISQHVRGEFEEILKPFLDTDVVYLKLPGGVQHSYFALARLLGYHEDNFLLPWLRAIISGEIKHSKETSRSPPEDEHSVIHARADDGSSSGANGTAALREQLTLVREQLNLERKKVQELQEKHESAADETMSSSASEREAELKRELQQVRKQVLTLEKKISEHGRTKTELDIEVAQKEAAICQLRSEVSTLKAKCEDAERVAQKASTEAEATREELEHARANVAKVENEYNMDVVRELEKRCGEAEARAAKATKEAEAQRADLDKARADVAIMQTEKTWVGGLEKEINRLQEALDDIQHQRAAADYRACQAEEAKEVAEREAKALAERHQTSLEEERQKLASAIASTKSWTRRFNELRYLPDFIQAFSDDQLRELLHEHVKEELVVVDDDGEEEENEFLVDSESERENKQAVDNRAIASRNVAADDEERLEELSNFALPVIASSALRRKSEVANYQADADCERRRGIYSRLPEQVAIKCNSGFHDLVRSDTLPPLRWKFTCTSCHAKLQGPHWTCKECIEHHCFQCRPKAKLLCRRSDHDLYERETPSESRLCDECTSAAAKQFCHACDYCLCTSCLQNLQAQDYFNEYSFVLGARERSLRAKLKNVWETAETKSFNQIHISCHRDALILQESNSVDGDQDGERCAGCNASSLEHKPNYCWRCGCPWKPRGQPNLNSEEALLAEEEEKSNGDLSRLALHADRLHIRWLGGSRHSGARDRESKTDADGKHTPKVRALAIGKPGRDIRDSTDFGPSKSSHSQQCRSDPYEGM